MKRHIPLIIAAGLLVAMMIGLSPVAAPAGGPSLSSAVVSYSGGVMPMVVAAKKCPPKWDWNKNKGCCWNKKKKKCRCKDGKVWNQAKWRCVKK
jgi:hypothetical protein